MINSNTFAVTMPETSVTDFPASGDLKVVPWISVTLVEYASVAQLASKNDLNMALKYTVLACQ